MNIDIVLPLIASLLTVAIACLGVEMRLRPQKPEHNSRWRLTFYPLAFLLVVTTWGQTVYNRKAQDRIKKSADADRAVQDERYVAQMTKLDSIYLLTHNPPKELTTRQIAAAVRAIVTTPVSAVPSAYSLSQVSNRLLSSLLQAEAKGMREAYDRYWSVDDDTLSRMLEIAVAQHNKAEQDRVNTERAQLRQTFDARVTDAVRRADVLRAEALKRVTLTPEDGGEAAVFGAVLKDNYHNHPPKDVLSYSGYLDALAKRLPAE